MQFEPIKSFHSFVMSCSNPYFWALLKSVLRLSKSKTLQPDRLMKIRVLFLVLVQSSLLVFSLVLPVSISKRSWKAQRRRFGCEMFSSVYSARFWRWLELIWKRALNCKKKVFSLDTITWSGQWLLIKRVVDCWSLWLSSMLTIFSKVILISSRADFFVTRKVQ